MRPISPGRCSSGKSLEADRAEARLPSMAVRRRLGDPDCPFDLGVHLNLTQGRPLTDRYPPELLDAAGRFPGSLRFSPNCGDLATAAMPPFLPN